MKKIHIIVSAVAAACPAVPCYGATVTYQYYDILFGTSASSITSAPGVIPGTGLSGNGSAEYVTLPHSVWVSFGMVAMVTKNSGGGLAGFGLGVLDNNANLAGVFTSSLVNGTPLTSTSIPTQVYNAATNNGLYDGAGGVQANVTGSISGAINTSAATNAQSVNGAGSFAPLFNSVAISGNDFSLPAAAVFTPSQVDSQTILFQQTNLGATASDLNPYATRAFNSATDSVAPLPTLTVFEPGQPTAATNIAPIALLNTAPPVVYGGQIGSPINTIANKDTGTSCNVKIGYTMISGYGPSDTETFALKIEDSGLPIAAGSQELTDIYSSLTSTNTSSSAITGSYAQQFPASAGWDVLLTSTPSFAGPSSSGQSYLALDLLQESGPLKFYNLTVAEISVVPEPSGLSLLAMGSVTLLRRRRI